MAVMVITCSGCGRELKDRETFYPQKEKKFCQKCNKKYGSVYVSRKNEEMAEVDKIRKEIDDRISADVFGKWSDSKNGWDYPDGRFESDDPFMKPVSPTVTKEAEKNLKSAENTRAFFAKKQAERNALKVEGKKDDNFDPIDTDKTDGNIEDLKK